MIQKTRIAIISGVILIMMFGAVKSQQQMPPPWTHWQTQLCRGYDGGMTHAYATCAVIDPFGPCVYEIPCDGIIIG